MIEAAKENINLKKMIPDRYPFSGPDRKMIVSQVLRMGVLEPDGSICAESKQKIYDYFTEQKPSRQEFAAFLNQLYAPDGYRLICQPEDVPPYTPFRTLYNNAGLQFHFRDKNYNIHIECLLWSEVARRIGKMIGRNDYLQENKYLKEKTQKERER